MTHSTWQQVAQYRQKRRRRSIWYRVLSVMAAIVVFCTSYALILPAITKEEQLICNIEEHTHDSTCFPQAQTQFICTPLHTHDAACYDENSALICGKADYVIHTHEALCYDESGECICPLEDYPPDTAVTTSTVAQEALKTVATTSTAVVTATTTCVIPTTTVVLQSDIQETTTTTSISPIGILHTHTQSCYDSNGVLPCGRTEITKHIHTEDCLTTLQVLTPLCGKEEHRHLDACYASQTEEPREAVEEADEPREGMLETVVEGETQVVISVSGVLPEKADLQVHETTVETDALEVLAAYDIEILDEHGLQYDPSGETLSVSIDAAALTAHPDNLTVYYIPDDGGEPEPMHTYVQDGLLCFDTTHFSKYVVVENPPVKIEVSSSSLPDDYTITCEETSCWYDTYTVLTAYKISVNAPWGTHWGSEPMEVTVTSTLFNGAQGVKVFRVSDNPEWNTAVETECSVSSDTVMFNTIPQECAQYFFAVVCSEQGSGGDTGGGDTGGETPTEPVSGNAATAQELYDLLGQAATETTVTLTGDITYTSTDSSILKVNHKVTIDLNGHTITCSDSSSPLFRIGSSGDLTICDSKATAEEQAVTTIDPLKTTEASTVENADGTVTLTYYVTDSVLDEGDPNGATIETVYKHTVTSAGVIKADAQPVFQVNGGALHSEFFYYQEDGEWCYTLK